MCRDVIPVLVIVGWIVLSGFDVLEDLDFPNRLVVSENSRNASHGSAAVGRGALANNMVESAYRLHQDYTCRLTSADLTTNLDAVADFRAYFQLHKLYRVFLI